MRILWLWHLMLGVALDAVHLVDIVEGTRRRRLVIVILMLSFVPVGHNNMIKKQGLALHRLVKPDSGSWSTSLDICGFAQAKRACLAPSAAEGATMPSLYADCHKACRAVVQPATSGELQLLSIYMKEVLKIAIFVSRDR